jgi:hypothetical protein
MAKPGPKPRGEFAGKGANLSARVTVGTHERLKAEAKKNRRSVSAELEVRLQRSFGEQADLRSFGSDESYALLRFAAEVMKDAQRFVGKSWDENPYAFALALEAVSSSFEALHPKGKLVEPDTFPNLPHLNSLPPEVRQHVRDDLVKLGHKAVARSLAGAKLIELEAAAKSGSPDNPLRQIALVLVPLITSPVVMREGNESAYQIRVKREFQK